MQIELQINGEHERFEARRSASLLDVLRHNGYTGAKRGCDTGACGFCAVIVDGEPRNSCVVPAVKADGATVETIEGLGSQDDLHPIQEAFVDHSALQCGFCIPGMIMRSKALLEDNPDPTEAEVREGLSENLCRCTGYKKIVEAVSDAADRMEDGQQVAADGGRGAFGDGAAATAEGGDTPAFENPDLSALDVDDSPEGDGDASTGETDGGDCRGSGGCRR